MSPSWPWKMQQWTEGKRNYKQGQALQSAVGCSDSTRTVQCMVLACRIHGGQAAAQTVHLQAQLGCCSCACCRPTCCFPSQLPLLLSMPPYCACAPPPSKGHLPLQVIPNVRKILYESASQILMLATYKLSPEKIALSKSRQTQMNLQSSLWAYLQ